MKILIYRFNPDKDKKAYTKTYNIKRTKADKMLLDLLIKIKAIDDSISMRMSCREGVCGSDAMNINGNNGLACITKIDELKQPITIRPVPGLPVIRDLVVDMKQFFKHYDSVKPYLINNEKPPKKERLQSPEDRKKLDGLYECIQCGACTTACPSFWWKPDKFVGPAGLLQAYKRATDAYESLKGEVTLKAHESSQVNTESVANEILQEVQLLSQAMHGLCNGESKTWDHCKAKWLDEAFVPALDGQFTDAIKPDYVKNLIRKYNIKLASAQAELSSATAVKIKM